METRQRALRRHHRARLKAKRRRYHGNYIHELPAREQPRRIGRLLQTPCPCSCWMCGNPRHHGSGPTLQEQRAALRAQEPEQPYD